MTHFYYTQEQFMFIKQNCDLPRAQLTELFNKKFSQNKTVKAISQYCKKNRLLVHDTKRGCFKKGDIPSFKGKKAPWGANKTTFKKGHLPASYKPVGTESFREDKRGNGLGYTYLKIAEKKWVLKHIYVWERHNGPITKGNCIVFLDGNPRNCSIENLAEVSRQEHAIMCIKGLTALPAELKQTAILTTRLKRTIKQIGGNHE